jgi:PKD repeat protein
MMHFVFIRSLLTTQGVAVQFDEFEGAYFYNVTDENNCEFGPIAITIGEPGPIEIVDTVVTQPDCNTVPAWAFNNGSICITITGGTNPFPIGAGWVDNGGGQWCLSGLTEGTYPLDVTDINGCPLFVPVPDVILTRPPEITAFFTDTLAIDCATDTATQTNVIFVSGGVPPYEITWSGGVWDPATQEVMQTSVGGIYTAFVNDQYGIANGCPPIPFVLDPITFFEFGIADFTLNSLNSDFCGIFAIDDPVNFQNTSFGDVVNFTWNFGDGSAPLSGVDAPTHIYNQLGEYTIDLTVEDAYGCFDTYSETIKVTKGYEIVLPNAFTPNGDGINETMRPVFSCMTNVQMGIYDTWGSLLKEIQLQDGTVPLMETQLKMGTILWSSQQKHSTAK